MIKTNLLFFFGIFSIIFSTLIPWFINPVISLFFLLLFIIFIFCFLIVLNIEYLALTFLMVYGGAILILFVFLILLTIKDFSLNSNYFYIPDFIYLFIYFLLLNSMTLVIKNSFKINILFYKDYYNNSLQFLLNNNLQNYIYFLKYKTNDIYIISDLLYSKYFFFLLCVIFILYFSMISSIALIKLFLKSNK